MNKYILRLAGLSSVFLPVTAFAQTSVEGFVERLIGILNSVIPFIIALAVIWFLWGVAQFVMSAGDEDARKKGRDQIIWGLVGLTVIFAFWGLVNIVLGSFDLSGKTQPTNPPQINTKAN